MDNQKESSLHEILDYCSNKMYPYQFREPLLKLSEPNLKAIQKIAPKKSLSQVQETTTASMNHISLGKELLLKQEEMKSLKASLDQQLSDLKNQTSAKQKEIKQKKDVVEKLTKQITTQTQQNQSKERSARDHWFAVKRLMRKYNVTTRHELVPIFKESCDNIFQKIMLNDKENGPYFDSTVHVLIVPINNKDWSCLFSPCTGNLATINESYSTLITDYSSCLCNLALCSMGSMDCKSYKVNKTK
ncbi:MAG TPA: hypothetical protein VJJ26_03010 [Candidatus Babeliales bacterium]|nr:hypothetical protein [Candidatus Babeliales bacterium]